jgi:hypothetical protein
MGVELKWNIESESGRSRQKQDDPEERRAGWRALRRLLLGIIILVGIVSLVVYLVAKRSEQIDTAIENTLRNTVEAEVAALRIGDQTSFLALQRSAAPEWLITQQSTYDFYQSQKLSTDLQLTGHIPENGILIDKQRARVQVEEIQNGTPYLRTWFYWRYDDEQTTGPDGKPITIPGGWRHVPPDYTLWGTPQQIDNDRFTLRYSEVDAPFAQALANALTQWLTLSCEALTCTSLPHLQVLVTPGGSNSVAWESGPAWSLIVPSPYANRARTDQPFETQHRIDIGTLLANRLVDLSLNDRKMVFPADATYLRGAVVAWLVGRYVETDTGSYLIDSIAQKYGAQKVGQLFQLLQPESDISILNALLGVSLDQTGLDWRDFLAWRLATEETLIQQRAEPLWQKLVDLRSDVDRNAAYARYNANLSIAPRKVNTVTASTDPDGTPTLIAMVSANDGSSAEQITFRLVNNVWVRVG